MKILVIADQEKKYIWDYFDEDRFKDIDLTISCGDLKRAYLEFVVTMVKAPLFYVTGNHDRRFETDPPLGCDLIDDKIVDYKGINILGLGGSNKYNNRKCQFTEKEMKKRLKKLKGKISKKGGIDILVTHAPAYLINDGTDVCHKGFETFVKILDEYKPKYFLHGHQHMNYGDFERVSKYRDTTIINGYGYYIFDY